MSNITYTRSFFHIDTPFVALVRKELCEYFATPMAFAVLGMFWMLSGYFFSFSLIFVSAAHLVTAFHNMSILLMLMIPLLTMRIFAEENKTGTLELLLTLPLSDLDLVMGKFIACVMVLFCMLAGTTTAVIPLILFAQPEIAPIVGGYVGVAFMGIAYIAIGLFISSLCRNQLVAAVVSWAVITLLWFADYGANTGVSPSMAALLNHLSFSIHYVDLIRGILNRASLVYFGSVIVLLLALTVCSIRLRRA